MKFSRLYVEKDALSNPAAIRIMERYSYLPVQIIERYQDIFNRKNQSFQIQKKSQALILAVKNGQTVYKARERVNSFHGNLPVYFIDPVRNCIFNCDYCFLQGMHQSGHLLYFVNHEDAVQAVKDLPDEKIYLSISYLTDLLGMEQDFGVINDWLLSFADKSMEAAVTIEIRSKSDAFSVLRETSKKLGYVPQNVILVWSLSPSAVAAQYERGTASFQGRLLAARQAVAEGWRVRLCLDPVIRIPDWENIYKKCISSIFDRIPPESIEQFSFGVFRLSTEFLKQLRSARTDSDILYHSFEAKNGLASYSDSAVEEMKNALTEYLSGHLDADQYKFVHG
ncbi:SPL family radical SAM protein [Spirochaeta dissipatitropha]